MTWNFLSKVRLTFALVALSLCAIGALATYNLLKLDESPEWIQRSHRVIQTLQKVNSDYKGIQAYYAEYLLTRREGRAKACLREIENIRTDMGTVRDLLSEDDTLRSWFKSLETVVERKTHATEKGLALCRAGHWDQAIAELKGLDDKAGVHEVRTLVNNMATVQAWMLKSRLSLESVSTHRSVRFIVGGVALTLLICAAAAYFVVRQALARKRTIRLLRSSEEKFRFLSQVANDALLTLDTSGTILETNPAAEGVFGYDRADLIGRPFVDLLPKEFLETAQGDPFEFFLGMTLKPGIHTLELNGKRKDGTVFSGEFSMAPRSGNEGTLFNLIIRDTTERKFFVKTLLKNEHRLFQFLDAVPVGVLVRDKMGMHYYANQTAREIIGKDIRRDQVTPQGIPEAYRIYRAGTEKIYPSDSLPMVRSLAGERSFVDDAEIRRPDRTIPIEAWGTPILDEDDGVKFGLMAFMDVSRQKGTTQSLREREEFFRNLFEEGPIGMNLSFPDTSIASVNRAFCEMLGYSRNEVIGKSFLDLTHPDDVETDRKLTKRLFEKLIPRYQMEKRFLTKSGTPILCKVSASSILDGEGNPMFRLAVIENITEQREAETALKQSEEKFRALTESANDAIVSADSTGRIFYFNQAATRLFGYTHQEALGRPFTSLLAGDLQAHAAEFQKAFAGGTSELVGRHSEWTGLDKDGREFPFELSLYTWYTDQGVFATAVMRDITERKQVDDMKRDLISVVSHQLKTPVAEINGYIENLLEGLAGDLTQRQQEYLTDMREIGIGNYRLISDLLNMSKIERGVMTVDLQPVPLQEILEQALRDYEGPIRKKGLQLVFENAQKSAKVLADRDKTVETLRNIINNAVKCTDKGTITLRTDTKDGYSSVEVTDTGIGMAPEALSKLFTKERVMGQEAARAGAGLGLYIARHFMELQNGGISVRSEKGKGTSFFIRIPNHPGRNEP